MEGNKTNKQQSHQGTTQARAHRLVGPANWIFKEVLVAMQNAEELGGPEGDQYLALMAAIIEEAADRTTTFLDNRIESIKSESDGPAGFFDRLQDLAGRILGKLQIQTLPRGVNAPRVSAKLSATEQ